MVVLPRVSLGQLRQCLMSCRARGAKNTVPLAARGAHSGSKVAMNALYSTSFGEASVPTSVAGRYRVILVMVLEDMAV